MTTALLLFGVAVLAWAALAFNRLVRLRNRVRAAWADIDVQLTRRHDLVPQLLATVKAHASHERGTLGEVAELRARAVSLNSPAALGQVESALERALGRLFALNEAYPDLNASDSFVRLQEDLVAIEDHLQFARRYYNGSVRDYNTAIQQVPALLIARAFRFPASEFYQADADERAVASVGPSS